MTETTILLVRATDDLTPSRDLVAGAVRAGRQRRRRRSLVAGGALAALVGLGGTIATGYDGPQPPDSVLLADPPSTPATTTEPATMDLETWLRDHELGMVSEVRGWGDESFRGESALLFGSLVTVLVERTELPRCGEPPPGVACDSTGEGFESSATWEEGGGVRTATVTLFRPDGLSVTATSYNAPAEKGAEPNRKVPVLSVGELRELVRAPGWSLLP